MVDDYLGLMGGAANIGGAPAAIQNALLGQQKLQDNGLIIQAKQQASAEQQAYQQALSQALMRPSPSSFQAVAAQYPQFAKQTSEALNAYNQPQKEAMFRTAVTMYNLIGNGQWDKALTEAQAQKEAERVSGGDPSHWDSIIEAIQNRSPYAAGAAASIIQAYDPAKFAEVYKALNPRESMGPDEKQYAFDLQMYGKAYADKAKLTRDTKVVSSPTGVYKLGPGAPPSMKGGDPSAGGQASAQEPLSYAQFKAYADVQGPAKAASWAMQNGLPIKVATKQEYDALPSGVEIIAPDGSHRRKP